MSEMSQFHVSNTNQDSQITVICVCNDRYSKLGARDKDSQKLVFSKKTVFNLVFPFLFPKLL